MKRVLATLLVLATVGCGGKEESPAAPAVPSGQVVPSEQAATPQSGKESASGEQASVAKVRASVRVVGLDGVPLEGMEPIATTQPNAFDKPVAVGPATGKDGRSSLALPGDGWLYIRAWDRSGGLFANNFFDIPPGEGNQTAEMEIVMVPGTRLKATLVGEDGTPAAGENVGLMLFHPMQGPWWPGDADTDENGVADFGRVPAGRFTLKIKAIRSGQIELPETYFPPGETLDLGTVTLR